MTKDPNDAYNHFAHLNKFLKKDEDYRNKQYNDEDNELLSKSAEKNIYKKCKSSIKEKGRL
ncbi:hypothetical protein BUZ14_10760 [Staphylococcus gallinarum]|uniref:Uncharacterized protein n=1 Tax=Staphylococcus gallinarum TaxID=1293 RepID=A0A3A0VYQ6_STAGA|nr:hypothetical protein [Staphylococcus gallinarum]RIP33583.1 hypothetical protein BUZ14_10760 [Staphylococcus gallinarum]